MDSQKFSALFWSLVEAIKLILVLIVHIAFAIGVYYDADRFKREYHKTTALVTPPFWTLATLLGGVFVAAIYWFIHRSTLSGDNSPNTRL